MTDIMDGLQRKARDHARNPMQWDSSPHGGFTSSSAKPWMRVHDDHTEWNVKAQRDDPTSVFGFWKRMLLFRKKHLSSVRLVLPTVFRRDVS
jgi:alpha-glucosidase